MGRTARRTYPPAPWQINTGQRGGVEEGAGGFGDKVDTEKTFIETKTLPLQFNNNNPNFIFIHLCVFA
jgi:hypothetical protein